jgi:5-methylcytosine-specific restriction endonuclease McrA
MMPFRRQPAPEFWAGKEAQWAERVEDWSRLDPLGWQHENRTLREWFHSLCRGESEPPLCAYCDGALKLTARETIDHFAPRARFQALALVWHNLFPACDLCNETYKGAQ